MYKGRCPPAYSEVPTGPSEGANRTTSELKFAILAWPANNIKVGLESSIEDPHALVSPKFAFPARRR